jgi:hypothetical protein
MATMALLMLASYSKIHSCVAGINRTLHLLFLWMATMALSATRSFVAPMVTLTLSVVVALDQ